MSREKGRTWVYGLVVILVGLLLGCNKGTTSSASSVLDNTHGHYHTSNWMSVHPGLAIGNVANCTTCHEMTTLRSSGGAPSCATTECHHKTIPGYAIPGLHGTRAKIAQTVSGGGLVSCQVCHGRDFSGGVSGKACSICHIVKAPHPLKPWRNASGISFAVTHANTDPSNATVCAQCHFPGSPNNPAGHPSTPAPAGTAAGCFNNTLCHANNVAPHAMGSIWKDPTSSAFHGFEAKKDLVYCQSCHGTPGTTKFDGGVAPTACSSCHTAAKAHSKPWYRGAISTFPGYVASHRNAGNKDVACALCHDVVKIRTAPNPAAPSCFSDSLNGVGCHANGPGQPSHAVPFLDTPHTHVVQSAFNSNCANCHAVTGASPLASAPTCITCHQSGSPLALANCTSCHAKPPSGTAFPNNAGKHAKHLAVAGTPTCSACHNGVESGTLTHYDHANGRPGDDALRKPPAPVSTQATFNAKAGPAAFNPATLTCSNISCHGGKPAPSWQTGIIDSGSDAGCRACHTLGTALGVPENNSPYSGTHALHLGVVVAALCTDCHAMGTGTTGATNHFKFLGTTQMEGPASDTIAPMGNPAYYKPSDQTCGTFTCHDHLHTKTSWQGGPNHAVPYLGAPHVTTTQGTFDLDCKSCHAVSTAPSPLAAAPLCSACHQGGSPLSLSNCASCHAKPPSGSAFPNIAGKHAKHESLAGITGACSSCHESFDSGTKEHYDHANGLPGKDGKRVPPAPMKAMSDFNAKSGTASLDPATLTCSNISCHGGIKTPSWQTGTIDPTIDAGCRQCHSLGTALGVPERNSLYSGMHALHLGIKVNALCTECHAMGNGSTGATNHFKFLNTPQMEGPASGTVAPMGNPAYYKPSDQTCGTFSCHDHPHGGISWDGGANHAIPYLDAKHTGATQAAFDADCKACHGLTGTSSPLPNAPTCVTCHQAGSPLSLANCTSCHAKPPAGTVFPDVAGKHTKHNALVGVTSVCAACHTGSESGTQVHYDHANARPGKSAGRVPPAPVTGAASYNAKVGASTFNPTALTCSNVSCHGGVTTPSWATGTINSTSDAGCVLCHKEGTALGLPESNSYYSGLHGVHMAAKVGAVCSECHGMSNGSAGATNHFKFLGTTQMEGPASGTVMPMGNASWYQSPAQTCGTFNCHGTLHTNFSWKGGANHAIPFTGVSHTGINSGTSFNTSCASCHGLTGATSPMALAPTCSTCHQAGTPTTLANCASCHAKPPTGTVFPDVAGKHAKHNALAGVANVCAACHTGSDTGSQTHYDHANARPGMNALRVAPGEVTGSGAYNAKAGTAAFNPATLTCSNVSCHGGVLAPSWTTGTINSTTDAGCVQCHKAGTAVGVPENNSYYSGLHSLHLAAPVNAVCTECHLMANGTLGATNHFKFLGTPLMEGPASTTVVPMGSPLGQPSWYQSPAQTCGTFNCHGTLHTNFSWKGGANHAIPFTGVSHTGINSGTSFNTSCASCHGLTGATSPMALAPTCSTCHQAGTPTTLANCASCHAKPPTGTVFPDVAGKHAKHDALAGVTNVCAACHTGSDTGSQTHYDHANARPGMNALRVAPGEVAGSGAYNAKAGTAAFNPATLTCSNVSCHGGVLAPSWTTGTINSTTDAGCVQCHKAGTAVGVPENNSFYSGLHNYHLASPALAVCSDCHNMANGTTGALNHFKFLGTAQMEGPASNTVMPMGNASYYQSATQTCGTFDCHGKTHGNLSWQGHAIPYRGTSHTSINTPAAFTTSCASCHAQTGTVSPMALAPTCVTCHQKGTPTSLLNCTSCHAKPPTGTTFPDIAGTHPIHNTLIGVNGNCDACHTGVGIGSTTHYDHANARVGKAALRVPPGEVAVASLYNAKTGAAAFNPATLTCSNISCHGGQVTPNWQTTASIAANCTACHARGTTQYNSFNSGEHKLHVVGEGYACTQCHNMTSSNTKPGALNHFTTLGTPSMDGPAGDTISFVLGDATGTRTYTVAPNKYCNLSCHGKTHNSGMTW